MGPTEGFGGSTSVRARAGIAGAVAVLLLVLAFAGAQAARQRSQADADRTVAADAGAYAARVSQSANDVLAAARGFAITSLRNPAAIAGAPPQGATAAARATLRHGVLVGSRGTLADDLLADPAVATAAGTARDTARVTMAAPVDGQELLAVALYTDDAGNLTTDPPGTATALRRSASAGFVVLALDAAAMIPATDEGFSVGDGETVLAGRPPDDPLVAIPIQVRNRTWTITATPAAVALPPLSVGLVVGGLLIAIAVAAVIVLGARDEARARAEADARRAQSSTVRSFAAVVEHSLDIAEVLPAIAVLLHDELGVDGFSVATMRAGAEELLFVDGVAPDATVQPAADVPDVLPSGATVAVALRSASRTVATARLRAGRPLDAVALESVSAACELLTAALVNARAFERQQEAVQGLKDLDELKTVFLGVASHELRTPVTAIGGFARMLDERWDNIADDQRSLLLSRIVANATALGSLVQDLLDFSRLERGKFVVATLPFDLAERVEGVLDRLAPIWDGRHVGLRVDDRPTVLGDVDGVERIVANLVSNATKFSPAGSSVVVTVTIDDGWGVLRVDDAGPGVAPEDRERIFSRFFRGSGAEVVATRGAGIGLSVVNEFVEQMGGSVVVGESPDGGARFEVRLPLSPAVEEVAAGAPS